MSEVLKGGILYLNIIKATDTLAMDVNGLSDPYTKIFLDSYQEGKTHTIDKTLNPVWNETFGIHVPLGAKALIFEVWDKDKASADDFMGRYEMSLENLDTAIHPMSVALGPKAGKKSKPGKKEKNRGIFHFEYQYLTFAELNSTIIDRFPNVLETIITKTPHDGVAQALIAMLQSDLPRLATLMKTALTYEINQTPSSEQLFRTDSMTTKLMKASSKLLGSLWLFEALQPYIAQLCATNASIEVDPLKLAPGASASEGMVVLTQSCQDVLAAILNSFNKVPTPLQDLIRMIADVVGSKFPESRIQAVSGYVFLRFFGPGILAPEAFGLGVEPQTEAKRHLILIAKVIQTVANGSSVREEFLKPLAPWIEEQHGVVNQHLLQLVEGPAASHPLPIPHQSPKSLISNYKEIVSWIISNQPVLDRHGISEGEYNDIRSALEPYGRALGAAAAREAAELKSASSSSCPVSNLFRSKSKK